MNEMTSDKVSLDNQSGVSDRSLSSPILRPKKHTEIDPEYDADRDAAKFIQSFRDGLKKLKK